MRAGVAWFLIACALPSAAQEKLETRRTTIDVPAGWKAAKDGEQWFIRPADGPDEYAIALGGDGMDLAGGHTTKDALDAMWRQMSNGRALMGETVDDEQQDPSGRAWRMRATTIQEGGAAYVMALAVVEVDGRAHGFMVMCTPEAWGKHEQACEATLFSVKGRKPAGAAPASAPASSAVKGVYTATLSRPRATLQGNQFKLVTGTLVLFADGSALWRMPARGLAGFVRGPDPALDGFWGTYTVAGKKVTITQPPNTLEFELLEGGVLERRYVADGQPMQGERYHPRPSPDGRPFDGELRREGAWDPILAGPGCTFTKDGAFKDDGLIRIVQDERVGEDPQVVAARGAPGQGRYRIEAWTLILDYADGRQNRVSVQLVDGKLLFNTLPIEPRPR